MAKTPKTPPRKKRASSKPEAKVVDAELVVEEAVVVEEPAPEVEKPEDDTPEMDEAAKAEKSDPESPDPETPEAEQSEPQVEVVEKTAVYVQPDSGSSGLFPSILGGVIAGALGFGAAMLIFPDGWREKDDSVVTKLQAGLAEQKDNLSDLAGQVGDLSGKLEVDFDAVRAELAEKATAVGALRERLEGLTEGDGMVALPDDVQVLLNAQKEKISELSADVAAMAENAKAQMLAATAQQETAEEAEARVKARGAMQVIRLALVSGDPFADALAQVAPAVDVPEGLQAVAADGVPTAAALQQAFPVAARKALSVAVREEAGDDTQSRWQLFLKDQLGARSLTPQEGDSGDAILSRAEAAVKADDLTTALSEIEALPEAALAELADWQAKAQARVAAVDGFEAVSDALNGN